MFDRLTGLGRLLNAGFNERSAKASTQLRIPKQEPKPDERDKERTRLGGATRRAANLAAQG